MADLVSKVLMKFTADNKDAVKKVQSLKKENKKLTKEVVEGQEKQIKALELTGKSLKGLTIAVGASAAAFVALNEAQKVFAKDSRLREAARGADIKAIQEASAGLLTETQALQLAAVGLGGDFKASQKGMEDAAKFMVILRNEGFELDEVMRDVSQAIGEANPEALKKYGRVIKTENETMRGLRDITSSLADESARAGDNILRAGDEAERSRVKWRDALHNLVVQLGEIGNKLTPIVELMTVAAKVISEIVDTIPGLGGPTPGEQRLEKLGSLKRGFTAMGASEEAERIQQQIDAEVASARRRFQSGERTARTAEGTAAFNAMISAVAGAAHAGASGRTGGAGRAPGAPVDFSGSRRPGVRPDGLIASTQQSFVAPGTFGGLAGRDDLGLEQLEASQGRQFDAVVGEGFSGQSAKLQEMVKDFDATAFATDQLSMALDGLGASGAQAFQALLTGTESFGAAFKKAIGNVIISQSSQLFGESIKEGVLALVSLAGGDLKGAGLHGSAAAAAAAGAATLAGLAKAMGATGKGGQEQVPKGAGDSGGTAAIGGAPAGDSRTTIFVGSDFGDNPRSNAERLRRAFERSRELEGDANIVTFE